MTFLTLYYEKFKHTATFLEGFYRGHPNTQPPAFYQLKFLLYLLSQISINMSSVFILSPYLLSTEPVAKPPTASLCGLIQLGDRTVVIKGSGRPLVPLQWDTWSCDVHQRAGGWIHVSQPLSHLSLQWFGFVWDFKVFHQITEVSDTPISYM